MKKESTLALPYLIYKRESSFKSTMTLTFTMITRQPASSHRLRLPL